MTVHTRIYAYMHTCVNIIDAVTEYGGQIQQTQSCYEDTIILACWYTRHNLNIILNSAHHIFTNTSNSRAREG